MRKALAAAACLVLLATAASAAAISLVARDWQFRFGSGISGHPTQDADGGFSFAFPSRGDIDYLTRPYSKALPAGGKLYMQVKIDASPDAAWVASDNPSNCP